MTETFKFAQMTDTHLYSPKTEGEGYDRADDFFRKAVRECAAHDVDFIVNTGDLCSGGSGLERHQRFKGLVDEMSQEIDRPYYIVRGNHDNHIPDDTFVDLYGPTNFWFEHKGWAFLAMDRWYYGHQRAAITGWKDMSPETLAEIDQLIEQIPREMPVIAMMHEPPVGSTGPQNGHLILEHLRKRDVKILLFAHVHCNYITRYHGLDHAVPVGEANGFSSEPLSYNIVTCEPSGTVSCDFQPYRMNIPSRAEGPAPAQATSKPNPASDWQAMRGPTGTRVASDSPPANAPGLAWRQQLTGTFSIGGPTVSDGTVYLGTHTQGRFDQCTVQALDAATGEVKWATPTDGGVCGGIRLDNGRGFCGTTSGSVYCLDLNSGQVIWRWNNEENLPFASEPTLDEGLIHIGANYEAYAIDISTGRTKWRSLVGPLGSYSYFSPGHCSPVVVGQRVYHQRPHNPGKLGPDTLIQSLEKYGGWDLTRSTNHANFAGQRHASALVVEGKIVTQGSGTLLVFDPANLEQTVLEAPTGSGCAMPAAHEGVVYIAAHRSISACDLNTGEVRWSQDQMPAMYHYSGGQTKANADKPGFGSFSAPLVAGQSLIVCDTGGFIRAFNLPDGEEQWRIDIACPILSAPTLSGNTLYVADTDGRLHAFAW